MTLSEKSSADIREKSKVKGITKTLSRPISSSTASFESISCKFIGLLLLDKTYAGFGSNVIKQEGMFSFLPTDIICFNTS